MQIWVSETSNNIPGPLFVYQQIPPVPESTDEGEVLVPKDKFVHVASYADVIAFPSQSPSADNPYFRLTYVDLVHDSRDFLEERWKMIQAQLKHTVEDVVRINILPPAQVNFV